MTDAATVRKAIHEYVRLRANATYDDVVDSVAENCGVSANMVATELDKLQDKEFAYLNDVDGETVVKVA